MKAGPDEACHEASARRLDRGTSPGPDHGFTLSTSGRDSLLGDDGRCGHSSLLPRWAQLFTCQGLTLRSHGSAGNISSMPARIRLRMRSTRSAPVEMSKLAVSSRVS